MGRKLLESDSLANSVAPLTIDRDKKIIFGVRVLGAESRNRHGERNVDGTEYTENAHKDAVRLCENIAVLTNHNIDPNKPGRSVDEPFGVLRNLRTAKDKDNRTVTEGDLHYYESHPITARVLEDVERKIGNYGLSHHASSTRDRVDQSRRRLVIEGLDSVRSVDLVFRPSSNRNLWESQESTVKKIAFRALLEQLAETFDKPKSGKPQPNKAAWARRLLEDDNMLGDTGPLTTEVEVEAEEEADPEDAIEDAFCMAVTAIVRGEGAAEEKLGKIELLLQAQEAISGEGDAAEAPESGEEQPAADKKEQLDEKAELARLREEKVVRVLCEQEKFTPNELQLETLVAIREKPKQRRLIEQFRTVSDKGLPKSGGGAGGGSTTMPTGETFVKRLFS